MSLDRYRRLAALLKNKTEDGSLSWSLAGDQSVLQSNISGYTLQLSESDGDRGSIYTVDIFNKDGDIIDSFNDEDIDKDDLYAQNFYGMMRETFHAAKRKASGADRALDEILKSLDEMFPF
ncbi:hypothetical protein [Jiella avicenniae]|uniref:Uncharacterized protein n=1 Tax=Jiella avicenniae TaxID=2907202 RepID=A0A9X1P2C8_9HYPH|nr:hypothetical protein [Jiella avicenniae]MCE7030112.1 hypothetical protein [Jiella avicenniae]